MHGEAERLPDEFVIRAEVDAAGRAERHRAHHEIRDGGKRVFLRLRDQPEQAWEVILEILDKIDPQPSDKFFQLLAAGPLEDLLAHHGEEFIERWIHNDLPDTSPVADIGITVRLLGLEREPRR